MIAPRMVVKVYCRYVGEHSQTQGHLGESTGGMTRLSWAM